MRKPDLDKLVKGSDEFPITRGMVPEENKRRLLLKKGIYPYEYMDSFEKFGETRLLEKEKFYSSLSGKGITDEEYAHAKDVWATGKEGKEGPLGGPSWVSPHQISGEERIAAREDRSPREAA